MPSEASNYSPPSGGPRIRLQPAPNEPMNLLDPPIDIEEEDEVQMDEDPCCEEAKQHTIENILFRHGRSLGYPTDLMERVATGIKQMDCDTLRQHLEGEAHNKFNQETMAVWDACSQGLMGGDFTASQTPMEAGWGHIVKWDDNEPQAEFNQTPPFPPPIRGFIRPIVEEKVQMTEDDDPCCSEARELLATYISEKAQNEPVAVMANAMMGLYEEIMRGGGDWSCEDIQWKMERWAQGSDWERKVANAVLDHWNECSETDFRGEGDTTSMFTASQDPMEVGWGHIIKIKDKDELGIAISDALANKTLARGPTDRCCETVKSILSDMGMHHLTGKDCAELHSYLSELNDNLLNYRSFYDEEAGVMDIDNEIEEEEDREREIGRLHDELGLETYRGVDDPLPREVNWVEEVPAILEFWTQCAEQGGDFTASQDPMEVGWGMIVKEGLEDVPDENKYGNCYEEAGMWVCFNPGYSLAHAQVTGQGPIEGQQYGHAFATYMGDTKGNLHEGEPVPGEHVEWAYDPLKDVRLPLSLYSHYGRFNSDNMIRYTADELREKILEHETWGPWDERAKEWLHSEDEP